MKGKIQRGPKPLVSTTKLIVIYLKKNTYLGDQHDTYIYNMHMRNDFSELMRLSDLFKKIVQTKKNILLLISLLTSQIGIGSTHCDSYSG